MSTLTKSERHSGSSARPSKVHATQVLDKQMEASRKAHEECLFQSKAISQEVSSSLQNKVADGRAVLNDMNDQLADLDSHIEGLKESHRQLLATLRSKEGPMILCCWRMGQRETLPLREQGCDAVAAALDQEKNVILAIEKELNELVKTTVIMIGTMETSRERLQSDINQKTQAMKVDELCLCTAKGAKRLDDLSALHGSPWPRSGRSHAAQSQIVPEPPGRSSLPLRPPSRPTSPAKPRGQHNRPRSAACYSSRGSRPQTGGQIALQANVWNELIKRQQPRPQSSRSDASARTRDQMDLTPLELCEDIQQRVKQYQKALAIAKRKTDKALQERVTATQKMKKRLEIEVQEVKKKQTHAKGALSQTKSQMAQLEEPMSLCTMFLYQSKMRACSDPGTELASSDLVGTRLEEQKDQLIRTTKELRYHRQMEKGILAELDNTLERLKEDLRDKALAFVINLQCLKQADAHGEARYSNASGR